MTIKEGEKISVQIRLNLVLKCRAHVDFDTAGNVMIPVLLEDGNALRRDLQNLFGSDFISIKPDHCKIERR